MKVKAVVFDLGKVLVDFDYGIAARKLALTSKASAEEIRTVIDQSPLLFSYESAQMTTQQFFDEVRVRIGFPGSFAEFAFAFADIFTEIPEMTRLQKGLRSTGLPTFVLSNTNEIAIGHVRRNFPFFANFDGYIFSFEHAVLKPHARIYEITEQQTGCRNGEILFLDDKPENVEAAAKRDWQTICHCSPEESIRAAQATFPNLKLS
ncbi:MAG TPA: HAD family phosphatase [Candidatus Limnocylindria bacterium]|nr:HAD family phosphatase [Candidatus Limnocylindria bacterium]